MGGTIAIIADNELAFQQALSTNDVNWGQESQFAMQALQKNDFLAKTASNNVTSLQNAIINVAAIGISLNPALKHAYLVPRDKAVCLDVSYMGLLHLAKQSGAIKFGQAKLVYSNDTYQNKGVDKAPLHEYKAFLNRGKTIGVYCTVKLPTGEYLTEEMDLDAINQVRNTSKAKDSQYSPWNTFPEEMMRKTVVKRASKYWSAGERLATAIDTLNEHEGLETQDEKVINEVPEPAELPDYPEDHFNDNFPAWQKLVASGKNPENIVNMISSRYALTEDMRHAILNIKGQ